MTQDPARLRLGRIRCLRETVTCLEEMKPLPEALCFVPKHVEYLSSGKGVALAVHTSPSSESKKLDEIKNDVAIKIQACGLDTWNDEGQWIQLTEVSKLTRFNLLLQVKFYFRHSRGWEYSVNCCE